MEIRNKAATLLGVFLLSIGTLGVAGAQTPPAGGTPTAQPAATSVPVGNVTLYATTKSNKLVRFSSSAPATIAGEVQVTGLQSGENLAGIDYRAATGQLFAVGSTSRLYTLDPNSGAATVVGTVLTTTLNGNSFGFDFNPTVDRIRLTSDADQDLRLNPNNGTVAAIDGTLAYTTTDRNAGQNPNIVASAYTNNFPGPPSTTLYNIDSNLDVVVTQNPPNSGTLNTVGALGVDVGADAGFDIVGANTAFAALQVGAGPSGLYTINLGTGAATLVGNIGTGEAITGLTGMLSAAPATVTPAPTATTTTTPLPTPTACAGGVVNMFTANASGAEEVPPTNSQATASGTFTLDPATNKLTINVTIQGSLTTTETGAHLHRGAVGVNGPVIIPLPVGANKSLTVDFPAEEVANLRAGNFYINIHTTQFPAGEIRGQLVGQCPGGTAVPASTATSVATSQPTLPPAPPAPTSTLPAMPTEVLPTQEPPTQATPVTPSGMPSTGSESNGFFYLLLAFTGVALIGAGVMSRRPAKR